MQVEYSAEKAGRYRYKYADAEKSRVELGPEQRLEDLFGALELNDPRAYRRRAGMPPPPSPKRAAPSHVAEASKAGSDGRGGSTSADASRQAALESQLLNLRKALGAAEEEQQHPTGHAPCSHGGGGNSGWSFVPADNGGSLAAPGVTAARSAPPAVGAGRNSRSASGTGANKQRSAPVHTPGAHRPAGYGAPTPPGGGNGGSSPRPGAPAPPGSGGSGGGGRSGGSPRRFRVSSDQSAASHAQKMGITPSPPTTPREPPRRATGASSRAAADAAAAATSSAPLLGVSGAAWDSHASVYISPRPSETDSGHGRIGSAGTSGSSGGGGGRSKENRSGSAGGARTRVGAASSGAGSPYSSSSPPGAGTGGGMVTAANAAAVGAALAVSTLSDAESSPPSAHGGMRAEQRQRERLRESTNTRSASQQQQQQVQHGAGGGGVGCQPGSSPPGGQVQYYALSQRGGAAQPLSDMDFVHALLGDRSSGGGGVSSGQQPRKQRNASSAGGQRGASSARESSSGHYGREGGTGGCSSGSVSAREHSMKDMHSAYAKPRGSSAYARSAGQRGVQAW